MLLGLAYSWQGSSPSDAAPGVGPDSSTGASGDSSLAEVRTLIPRIAAGTRGARCRRPAGSPLARTGLERAEHEDEPAR